ncbi:hypothetical protein H7U18_26530 [Klebsiella pneumoniae]|uniref:Uncharacterized protein n=1 Tax=Klebsiella pneumoniae TaxID=573 RepID=A0A923ENV2_KLEPN|nr:hypothetical protein [Klebsiella pneumoniae]
MFKEFLSEVVWLLWVSISFSFCVTRFVNAVNAAASAFFETFVFVVARSFLSCVTWLPAGDIILCLGHTTIEFSDRARVRLSFNRVGHIDDVKSSKYIAPADKKAVN